MSRRAPPKRPEPAEPAPASASVTVGKAKNGQLVMTKTFPEGVIAAPRAPGVAVRVLRPKTLCAACNGDRVRRYASSDVADFYECERCADPDTLRMTRFKVVRS